MSTTSLRADGGVIASIPAHGSAGVGRRRARLAVWLWSGALLTFVILVVGGITRLTQSGLSMVDWEPFVGVIPPIGEAEWTAAFDRYQQFPEYQRLRPEMDLAEFKFIFFWEYIHRVAARLIGVVFLLPYLYFLVRGYFGRATMSARRPLVLLGLGGLQGFVGWFMVSSGLVDHPHVSHYRLALHLTVAFAIFGCCVWFALDVGRGDRQVPGDPEVRRRLMRGLSFLGVLLGTQILWGALVAGLNAGFFFNTFPLMGDTLVPAAAWGLDPFARNLVENPIAVQWVHRVLGTVLLAVAIGLYFRIRSTPRVDRRSSHLNRLLVGLVATQYLLGVVTLLLSVPVPLGVTHQAMAMIVFGVWIAWLNHARGMSTHPTVTRTR